MTGPSMNTPKVKPKIEQKLLSVYCDGEIRETVCSDDDLCYVVDKETKYLITLNMEDGEVVSIKVKEYQDV